MLQPWLDGRGLGDATQVLIYFAVAKQGEDPSDGKTDLNPEGLTAACGKWAPAVAARLHRKGLACHVLDKQARVAHRTLHSAQSCTDALACARIGARQAFQVSMLEKLIWISAFMLVGACHPGATVGDVESKHTAEVSALIEELAAGASAATGDAMFSQCARLPTRAMSACAAPGGAAGKRRVSAHT